MPKFSNKSESELVTCDDRIIVIMRTAIQFFDFAVLKGWRGEAEQNKAYADGNSKLKYPESKHNKQPSLGIDIAPSPLNYKHANDFIYLAGMIMGIAKLLGYKLRWGGDWNRNNNTYDENFADLGHFEIDE